MTGIVRTWLSQATRRGDEDFRDDSIRENDRSVLLRRGTAGVLLAALPAGLWFLGTRLGDEPAVWDVGTTLAAGALFLCFAAVVYDTRRVTARKMPAGRGASVRHRSAHRPGRGTSVPAKSTRGCRNLPAAGDEGCKERPFAARRTRAKP